MLAFMNRSSSPIVVDDDSDDAQSVLSLSPFMSRRLSFSSGSATSYSDFSIPSVNMQSPAPSVLSLTDSMREQAFKLEFGRGINNFSDVYKLPADEEEVQRLDKQHFIFMDVMGKYCPPLESVMQDDIPGETKACLDLGCGSGAWVMDVARDFPNSTCVGVDLVPMQSTHLPTNCRSEVDDINLGLEHFYGDFNVVHTRLISSGIKDYAALIDQISRVLRPGGLIDLMEFDFCMYDEKRRRIDLDPRTLDGPAWPRWLVFVKDIARRAGGAVDAASHIEAWVRDHPMYEDVEYREFFIPVCAFVGDGGFWDRIGNEMCVDIISFVASCTPMLLGAGVPEDLVNRLAANVKAELESGQARQFTRCQCVHGRKRRSSPFES